MKFKHLMVDIETMGNQSFSAITSIGALEFDLSTGETGNEFYCKIDLQNCIDNGLKMNASTVLWWMKQNEEARMEIAYNDGLHLEQALRQFSNFMEDKNYFVWGNSARFDLGLLQNAYNVLGKQIPWDFRKERCLRTLVFFNEDIKSNWKFDGIAHNALSDCYNQIGYASEIFKLLNRAVDDIV